MSAYTTLRWPSLTLVSVRPGFRRPKARQRLSRFMHKAKAPGNPRGHRI